MRQCFDCQHSQKQGEMEASSELRMETMCLCVPLRLGVFFAAVFTFLTSLLYLFNRQHFEAAFRQFTGGYGFWSQFSVGLVEVTGVLFGAVGAFGAYYAKKSYVSTFNLWQFARLAAWVFMYYIDLPLMRTCELWVNDIQRMTKTYGWNATMYNIALSAECPSERNGFFVKSAFALIGFLYIVWCTSKYQGYMDRVPKHLLRVPKDMATGAFNSYSLGERAAMNGTYGMGQAINKYGVGFVPKGMMGLMATQGGLVGPPVHAGGF